MPQGQPKKEKKRKKKKKKDKKKKKKRKERKKEREREKKRKEKKRKEKKRNGIRQISFHFKNGKWMDLEGIILSEVSQKEKDKYHMLSFICGI